MGEDEGMQKLHTGCAAFQQLKVEWVEQKDSLRDAIQVLLRSDQQIQFKCCLGQTSSFNSSVA
jgi:hypothetical protein